MLNQNNEDASIDLCWCLESTRTTNLTFIFEEQRRAVFDHFIVLALK